MGGPFWHGPGVPVATTKPGPSGPVYWPPKNSPKNRPSKMATLGSLTGPVRRLWEDPSSGRVRGRNIGQAKMVVYNWNTENWPPENTGISK